MVDEFAAAMARYGRARYFGEYGVHEVHPVEAELAELPRERQEAAVELLASRVVPVGDWAAIGAALTVMRALHHPVELEAYRRILEGSLDFQRRASVWESQLSVNEQVYWKEFHPGQRWLVPQTPPTREEASIAPLGVGEERKVAWIEDGDRSRSILFVRQAPDRYVWITEYPDDSGGLARAEVDARADLYEVYKLLQLMPFPPSWASPEAEPFLKHPIPRLDQA
jgi:hypothetical protein